MFQLVRGSLAISSLENDYGVAASLISAAHDAEFVVYVLDHWLDVLIILAMQKCALLIVNLVSKGFKRSSPPLFIYEW